MSDKKKPEGYYWFLYWNPDDKRIFVPKRYGFGWTINFANPLAVAVLIAMVVGTTLLANLFK